MSFVSRRPDLFRQRDIREIAPPEGRLTPLDEGRIIVINPPPYFGVCRLETRRERPLTPTWLGEVANAMVHGPTFAVTSGNTLWQLDDETRLPFESAGYSAAFDMVDVNHFRLPGADRMPMAHVDRAALVMNRASNNYFHLAFEALPKLLLMEHDPDLASVPLVVDNRLVQSARDFLSLIAGPARQIIPVGPDQSLKVDRLSIASSCSYLPDDPALDLDRAIVDPQMVRRLADRVRLPEVTGPRLPLLWVSRRQYALTSRREGYIGRDIENSGEIDSLVVTAGGRIIEPERMTLEQQRREFASADIVAMAAGSAIVNLLFCRPGTRVLLLSQDQCVNPGLLLPIAEALGLELVWLFGSGVPNRFIRPHWNFLIDPINMRRALAWLQARTGTPDGILPVK